MADHPVDGFTLTRVGGWFGKNARGVLTFDVDHHIELGHEVSRDVAKAGVSMTHHHSCPTR